ncbi:hypothetical protein BDR05DRAFT_894559 [Suillus weaverae]|nr:hypothetical protein BDR05DRAFT_894559 [Suillus weaverae]
MQSLGPPPNKGSGALLVGTCSPEDQILDFTLDKMHRQIVKFIVANDQAREMVIEQWQEYFVTLKNDLALRPFMAITAHWIAKANQDSMLVLKTALLAFHHIPGSHDGQSLGSMILYLLDRADTAAKVSTYLYCRRDRFCDCILRGNEEGWFQDDNGDLIQLLVVELLLDEPTRWDSLMIQLTISYQAPHTAQQKLSSESTPLLSHAVPTFEELINGWESIGLHIPHCKPIVNIGLIWASKYTDQMGATHAYSVAMFIDPVMWMSWMDSLWEADRVKDAKEFILKLVCLCSKIKHDVGLIFCRCIASKRKTLILRILNL